MRILQVHNMYRSSHVSGDVLVKLPSAGLAARGRDVSRFEPTSDEPAGLSCVRAIPVRSAVLHRELAPWHPDVALVHHVFPTLGPHCVFVIANQDIPVGRVVHNYRHSCISGKHGRDGAGCELCKSVSRKSGVIRYLDDSGSAGLPAVASLRASTGP